MKIVLSGGDADTNAAVAGAILGAKFGINQIPEEWKDDLLYASMLYNKVQDLYSMGLIRWRCIGFCTAPLTS